jgi:hypothetical protein
MKSILDLNVEELGEILATNILPPDCGLQGIEGRSDFKKLFAPRPTGVAYQPVETAELKEKRLQIRELELNAKNQRGESITQFQNNIYKALQEIKDGQMFIMSSMQTILNKLNEG